MSWWGSITLCLITNHKRHSQSSSPTLPTDAVDLKTINLQYNSQFAILLYIIMSYHVGMDFDQLHFAVNFEGKRYLDLKITVGIFAADFNCTFAALSGHRGTTDPVQACCLCSSPCCSTCLLLRCCWSLGDSEALFRWLLEGRELTWTPDSGLHSCSSDNFQCQWFNSLVGDSSVTP